MKFAAKGIYCAVVLSIVGMLTGWIFLQTMEFSVHFQGKTYNHDLVCTHIFEANPVEMKKAIITVNQSELNWKIASSEFYHHANSCDWIRKEFNRDYFVSEQEQKFPLAFALNTYNSAYQIFRFLKIIYRPHNVYCIHYDQKSEKSFKKLMIYISVCLPNVIVPSKIENVVWGWHTIVDAQMNCMENLYELRHKFPWRYVITLCGKEVPLRTNKEIVDTLRKLHGTSAVELVGALKHEIQSYWSFKHVLIDGEVIQSDQKLGPVPFNLKVTKSMAYFGLSRTFVNFLLHNETAIKFRRFMDDTKIPDEHFIATLFKEGVPGGKDKRYSNLTPTISSYLWIYSKETKEQCNGINVNNICIVSSVDLHRLDYKYDPQKNHQTFFHNKFFIEKDQVVMDCAETELVRRNREECLKDAESLHIKNLSINPYYSACDSAWQQS